MGFWQGQDARFACISNGWIAWHWTFVSTAIKQKKLITFTEYINQVYQYIEKYSYIYIQREHFFPQKNVFCNLLTHLPTTLKKVLEKHRTMLSCTKPCKKGGRAARNFQGFVIKTHKEVLKKILVHPKNPTLLEYLHPGAQHAKENNLLFLHHLLWTALDGWGWIQVEIPSWGGSREEFCWNPPSSCPDRTQGDKGSAQMFAKRCWALNEPCPGVPLHFCSKV